MVITGRVPLLLLLGLVPVVLRPAMSTVWLWLLLVAMTTAVDWFLAVKPQSLRIERGDIGSTRLGHEAESRLTVGNLGTRPVRAVLRDAWQPSAGAENNRHHIRLAAGGRAVVTTSLCPRRRGDLRSVGVTVRAPGPLGLAARQRTLDVPGMVRSLPPFESRKHLPSRLARLRELDGRSAVRIRGAGTEFDSLREYVRGDDVRSIDWRASARNRNVVVRTWQPERDRRVVLVLDTSRVSAARIGDVPRLDAAMDAALLLAALAARAGDRVDFLAGDRRVRARVRAAGARDIAARLQEAMADLDPVIAEADWSALAGEVNRLGRQRALVVLLTPLEPASVIESLLPVLPALLKHHRVVVASVQDPALGEMTRQRESLTDVYGAAAAARVVQQRRRASDILAALGVHVVDADADQLPPALADHYLALKARGLL
ncbi:MAG: hypothetical protein JWN68_1195 [Nocardioides sp.]|jgi:uncharacterized protein (DUF58 family)|uniref:DUF58 domain-containing protein n=1 Tax=Nocardioides sp. TaxID=35761 RepID=UPI00260931E5|nr:DUF58 domain-containing protein [Nocardioides sp.]MCW2833242.1 hypothetical protein [Nocardioides sp.]